MNQNHHLNQIYPMLDALSKDASWSDLSDKFKKELPKIRNVSVHIFHGKDIDSYESLKHLNALFDIPPNIMSTKLLGFDFVSYDSWMATEFALSNNYAINTYEPAYIDGGFYRFDSKIKDIKLTDDGLNFISDNLKNYNNILSLKLIKQAKKLNLLSKNETKETNLKKHISALSVSIESHLNYLFSQHKNDDDFIHDFIDELQKEQNIHLFSNFPFYSDLSIQYNKQFLDKNLKQNTNKINNNITKI